MKELSSQMLSVVCRTPWTLSACWKPLKSSGLSTYTRKSIFACEKPIPGLETFGTSQALRRVLVQVSWFGRIKMAIEKFTINVSDALLADLRRRLDATRWPDELEDVGLQLGSSLSHMKSLADYWRNAYGWRRQEAKLNQLPQYRVALDGFHVHFVHVRSKDPKPLPLIITHGWPGSFIEMVKLIPSSALASIPR